MENEAVGQPENTDVLQGAPLIMRLAGGAWKVPSTDSWKDERSLQEIVGDNPTILPGVVDSSAAALLEFPIYRVGRVDVLCIEGDGTLTVCEVKLRRNPEIRRQVLGQVLAYAAGLAAMSYEEVDREWLTRTGVSLTTSVLGIEADPADIAEFQDSVRARLRDGRFRLVLAVDELTEELRSIIDYLSQHTDAGVDLLALELAYARHGEVEVLVPRVWGIASANKRHQSRQTKPSGIRVPLEAAADIIAAAEQSHPGAGQIVREILSRLGPRLSYLYVGNADQSSNSGCVLVADAPVGCQPLEIRPGLKAPGVRVCFDWMRNLGGDRVETLLSTLETNPTLAALFVEVRTAGFRKRPLVPFEVLEDRSILDLVLSAIFEALRPLEQEEEVTPINGGPFDRARLHQLMAAIPPGCWTTYGELAELSGTIGKALGSHIKSCDDCPNVARVLPSNGQPSPGFVRTDHTDLRTQQQELESEGVGFEGGLADPLRKIAGLEVARLADSAGTGA